MQSRILRPKAWKGVHQPLRSEFINRLVLASSFIWILVVTACSSGGGGGSTTTPPPPSPDFVLSAMATSTIVPPGGTLTIQLTVTAEYGFTGTASVNLTGAPAGTTSSMALPLSMKPGTQTLVLYFPTNAAQTTYSLTLQATSGSLVHAIPLAFQIEAQPLAGFSVVLNSTELSFAQGGSAFTTVGLSQGTDGNANYDVEFSVDGLPTGVQATIATNPLVMGQAATLLTISASSQSALANYAEVTVVGTRSVDGAQQTASFLLNVTPPTASIPPVRTDFVRMDGTPAAAVYDPIHDVVYASNTQWNRVDVISPVTHQIVKSVPAPSPTGMDLSLDGKHLTVTSNTQQIDSIDTTSLQVVQRTTLPAVAQGGATYEIPDLIANMANGTSLLGLTLNSLPPAYYLEQWNPTLGSAGFTTLTGPGIGGYINNLTRTGDGEKALIVDYGTDLNMAVYDAASSSFSASGQSPVGQVFAVAGNPKAHQFAIVGTSGLGFVDENLATQATPSIGGVFWGMQYSADGTKLYAATTLLASTCGPYYPVILSYDTSNFSLVGVAPAFQGGYAQDCVDTYTQAAPLAADSSGLVYSAYSHGMVIDDAANLHNLLNLPEGPPFPGIGFNDEAALSTTLTTSLGEVAYDVLPNVWFANTPGTDIGFTEGPLVSVTSPASTTAGLINVKAVEPDGWFMVAPQSFSYGSQILFPGGNAGSTQGGATLAMIGYGLVGNSGGPTVSIGGSAAAVQSASKYVDINYNVLGGSYPFPDMDEVLVTVPQGTAGAADITVTSAAGTATLPKAFNYVSVADYPSADTFTYVLYDPQRHWVYLTAGNHIDVFSADTQQFLSSINPPSVTGAKQIRGLALTPDNSRLLAANFADNSVAIINPDNPSSSDAVQIPVNVAGVPGVADVVATGTGNVFVDAVSNTTGGCGGEVFELNLATLKSTLRTDLGFSGLQVGGNSFSRSTDGSKVLLVGGGCGAYLWNAATDTFTQGLADGVSNSASGDGYWFASDYTRLDAQMNLQMQAQIPEFFSAFLAAPDFPGEKMNASGSLLYTPVPQGNGTVESNSVDITDTNTGAFVGGVLLTEQIAGPPAQTTMDFDESGNRLFLITNKGLTVVQLSTTPLSIGYLNPSIGSAGTNITIRGSGFESGATVTVGGTAAATTVVDSSTLTMQAPAGTTGGARVSVQNPDGGTYSLDAGFVYQ